MPATPTVELIVLHGPAGARRRELALRMAEELAGKATVVPFDAFHSDWLVGHDDDRASELDLASKIGKLVAVSYIRAGYHVIIEGSFAGLANGAASPQDQHLGELIALARTLPVRATVVNLVETVMGQPLMPNAASHLTSAVAADETIDLANEPIAHAVARIVGGLRRR